jgi:hypothetical protein
LPALAIAIAQPVWSRVDEAAHYDLLDQYAHGVAPSQGSTLIRPETLDLMRRTGIYRWDVYVAPEPAPVLTPQPGGLEGDRRLAWMRRHVWQYSYEAVQPPLAYLVQLPAWLLGDAVAGPLGAVYAVRLLDALVAALLAPLVWLLARAVAPAAPGLALALGLAVAVIPGHVLNETQVTNDSAGTVLGAALTLVAVAWSGAWTRRRVLLTGILLGAALLVKLTLVGVALAVLAAVLWPAAGRGRARRLADVVLLGGAAAACLAPWLVLNTIWYGAPTQSAASSALNTVPEAHSSAAATIGTLLNLWVTFWAGEPLLFTLRAGWPVAVVAALLSILGGAGVLRLLRTRIEGVRRPALALCLGVVIVQVSLSVVAPLTVGSGFLPPGRYLYPALAAGAVVAGAGLWRELRGRIARAASLALYGLASLVAISVFSLQGPAPPVGPTAPPPAAARNLGLSGEGGFAGLQVQVDEVFAEPGSIGWLHLTVSNRGSQAVERSPMPSVVLDGRPAGGGFYLAGSPLPERIAPGDTVCGWVVLHVTAGSLVSAHRIALQFPDVAPLDYSIVGPIEISWNR